MLGCEGVREPDIVLDSRAVFVPIDNADRGQAAVES